jgi:signal transduction histidine kinase
MNAPARPARWKPLARKVSRRFTGASIQIKTTGIAVAVVLLLGAGVTLQVRAYLTRELGRSLEERGVAVARGLAVRSTDLVLTGNRFGLYELIRETIETNPDVRYAFIADRDGQVVAHSFNNSVPPDLLQVNRVAAEVPYQVELLHSDEGIIHDIAVPQLGGRAGVIRVGLTEHRLQASIARAVRALVATTAAALLIGVVAAFLLTRVVTRPVLELVEVARAVSKGQLERKARRYMDDEIGELSGAFNAMTDALARSRDELLRHNRELAALNAVIVAVSNSHDLRGVLDAALAKTLEVVAATAGWIVLLEGERATLAAHQGLPQAFVERENSPHTAPCHCLEALRTGDASVLPAVQATCPRLERARTLDGSSPACHLSIPLQVKDKVLGVMNIGVAPGQAALATSDLSLLKALGQQVGVAIENARLWEELKHKEAQRGQLLEQLISAQEDERKRIARELHDEAGSALTSLLVGLRLLEQQVGTVDGLSERIGELKETCAHTLEGLHRLSAELRPSALDRLGLVAALEQMAAGHGQRWSTAVHFQALGFDGFTLPPRVTSSLYRMVQEALTNIARHAQARTVGLLLERRRDAVVLIVEDDGRGFDPHSQAHSDGQGAHLGLLGIRERAALLGGRLTIETAPGQGTTLFVEIPCEAATLAAACAETAPDNPSEKVGL